MLDKTVLHKVLIGEARLCEHGRFEPPPLMQKVHTFLNIKPEHTAWVVNASGICDC
jgi:hypothetical protein